MLAHAPDLSSLASSSSMLKLMLACIRYMGLKPIVHTVPMVMVWEEEQIPLSEILVTVLAQSLATHHGLNVIQPGTNSSMDERTTDHHLSVIQNFGAAGNDEQLEKLAVSNDNSVATKEEASKKEKELVDVREEPRVARDAAEQKS
ncbi:hypothetical protein DL769_010575 [Monosporascus sp. CRB-8-3]|nr:hypothetical protein DL769_010575 [Monosporascus sp. CRB-8-3]